MTGIMLPAAVVLAGDVWGMIEAFRTRHQGCRGLEGGMDGEVGDGGYAVWMACSGCGASLRRWFGPDDEALAPSLGARSRGDQS